MPRQSKFLCPIAGCGGHCRVKRSDPAPFAPRDRRKRICRKCNCAFITKEIVDGPIQLSLLGIDTDQHCETVDKVPK